LSQVGFWAFVFVLFRWIGGREVVEAACFIRLGAFRLWLSLGIDVCLFYFEGCSLGVGSDDGWWWMLCLQYLFLLRCPS
jgi:hypothetical protein